jgi:hypothetical protein
MQRIQKGVPEPLERLHTDFLVVMRCTANQRQSSLFEDGYTGQQLTTSSRATSHTICGCTRQGGTMLVWGTATTQCCTCSQQQYSGTITRAKHCNAKQQGKTLQCKEKTVMITPLVWLSAISNKVVEMAEQSIDCTAAVQGMTHCNCKRDRHTQGVTHRSQC